jgi:hypothetical protein
MCIINCFQNQNVDFFAVGVPILALNIALLLVRGGISAGVALGDRTYTGSSVSDVALRGALLDLDGGRKPDCEDGRPGTELPRKLNEEGGADGPWARNSAALFSLGAVLGGLTEATSTVSERLCPGTPSNVPGLMIALEGRGFLAATTGSPARSAEAFVGRGATTGGAMDATGTTIARLWPGVLAKV